MLVLVCMFEYLFLGFVLGVLVSLFHVAEERKRLKDYVREIGGWKVYIAMRLLWVLLWPLMLITMAYVSITDYLKGR